MLKLKSLLISALLLTAGMVVFGCILSPSSSSSSGLGDGAKLYDSYSYTAKNGQIIRTRKDTFYGCDSLLHLTTDTGTYVDTMPYVLKGDSLFLRVGIDSGYHYPGVFLQFGEAYVRVTEGTGLQGTWKYAGNSDKILSGNLSPMDKADFDSVKQIDAQSYQDWSHYNSSEIRFTSSTFEDYLDAQRGKAYVDEWSGYVYRNGQLTKDLNWPDSLTNSFRYNISLELVNPYTVKLTGGVTHEVVLRTRYGDGSGSYSSNNPKHATMVIESYLVRFSSIPNCADTTTDTTGYWLDAFYKDNLKPGMSLYKTALAKQGHLSNESPLDWDKNNRIPILPRRMH